MDLEDTGYEEHGVNPNSVHRPKDDHKKAIYLLSEAFAESDELSMDNALESWDLPEEPEPEYATENIEYYHTSTADRLVFDNDFEFEIYNNSRSGYLWHVLEDLSRGKTLDEALEANYKNGNTGWARNSYRDFSDEVLEDGLLPERYREEVSSILEEARSSDAVNSLEAGPETNAVRK
ncbi:MAG: UPF0058 family protein [Candidatus Nanohaloarchaea archaeon]